MKTICVPKNSQAQINLDFDTAHQDELVELRVSDTVIDKLYQLGFLKSINRIAGSNIDNYEAEEITDKAALLNVLNSNIFERDDYEAELQLVLRDIKKLFNYAVIYNTGIYFFL